MSMRRVGWLLAGLCIVSTASGQAQVTQPGQVVVSGAVPDETTRVALLTRLRELYGADRVQDQLTVGGVVTPPQWSASVQRLLTSDLKTISHGELKVEGTQVSVRGETSNEAARQEVVSRMATALTATYTVKNALRVAAAEQHVLDDALNNRIVEFESGSAILTSVGRTVLDDMVNALRKVKGKRVEVIGHTDSIGTREANLVLSQARADSVKNYLLAAGLSAEFLSTSGAGPDRPIAPNVTDEGRARNRRIEFRLGQ
jgi:OmpA-OmpF porin, OOP family